VPERDATDNATVDPARAATTRSNTAAHTDCAADYDRSTRSRATII